MSPKGKVREIAEEIAMSNRESVPGCAPDKYERKLRDGLKPLLEGLEKAQLEMFRHVGCSVCEREHKKLAELLKEWQ